MMFAYKPESVAEKESSRGKETLNEFVSEKSVSDSDDGE
jgi:hypothetical protein